MKKRSAKILSVLLSVLMMICSLPFVSFAQEDTQGKITWSFDEATATLTVGGEGAIKGYGVAADSTFDPPPWWKFLGKADKIVIEEGITEIGSYDFLDSTAKEIVFPSSLRKICFAAFMGNTNLKEIILPEGLKTIEEGAFVTCPMVEKVYIPESVEEMDKYFYSYLTAWKLKEFVFLPTTAQIYFYYPGSFTDYAYAEAYAYYYKCEYDASNIDFADDDKDDEFVYSKVAAYCNEKLNTSFPTEYSEANMQSMEKLFENNFIYCVPEWQSFVCKSDSALHKVFRETGTRHKIYETGEICDCFQKTGTYGENFTWSLDVGTRTLTLDGTGAMPADSPEYISIGRLIENIRFAEGSSVKEINSSAFDGIYRANIVIPATVEKIENSSVFSECEFNSVTVEDGNKVFFTVDGVLYERTEDGIALIYFPTTKTGEFIVPKNVTAIADDAFSYSNIERIIIPETVKSFGEDLFAGCTADVYFYDSADANFDTNVLFNFRGTLHFRPESKLCDKINNGSREFNVEMIEEKEIDHIEIETLPDKTVYGYREAYIADLTGLTVRVYFTDGTSEVRSTCYYMDKDFSTWKIGKSTLPIFYGGYDTSIEITVNPIEYTDIAVGESKTEINETNGSYYVYYRFVPETTAEYQFNYRSDKYSGVYSEIFDQSMERIASNGWDQSSMNEILYAGETYYISMHLSENETATISIDANCHPASDWILDKEPTCITVGSKHKECLDCGKTLVTEGLPVNPDANGELSDWIVDTDPTCAVAGKKHKECTDCHEILERSDIERKAHTPAVIPGKAATCEEEGLTDGSTCSVCGKILTAQETIPANGHTDSNNDGNCDNCGKKLRELTVIEKIKAFFQKLLDFFRNLFK